MSQDQVRAVVAEAASGRQGLLRFVLEGEGYQVVGDAADPAELAAAVRDSTPDVVILGDGIGASAVEMTRELAPETKVILVWPSAVVPIGGDAQVDPSSVLRDLGPTVERLTGVPSASSRNKNLWAGTAGAMAGGAALGDLLARRREIAARARTEGADRATEAPEPIIDTTEATPVLILPVSPSTGAEPSDPGGEPAAGPMTAAELATATAAASAAGAGSADAAVGGAEIAEQAQGSAAAGGGSAGVPGTEINRRLGSIALGGAAVTSALVLALSLSGSRVPARNIVGEAPVSRPPISSGFTPSPAQSGPGPVASDLGANPRKPDQIVTDRTGTTPATGGTDGGGGTGGGTGGGGGGTGGGGTVAVAAAAVAVAVAAAVAAVAVAVVAAAVAVAVAAVVAAAAVVAVAVVAVAAAAVAAGGGGTAVAAQVVAAGGGGGGGQAVAVEHGGGTAVETRRWSTAVGTTAVGTTAVETTAVETTAVETTAVGTTAVETTAVETTAVETTAVETTAVETTAVETTAVETTAVETTAVETTAVETTAVETTAVGTTAVGTTAVGTTAVTDRTA